MNLAPSSEASFPIATSGEIAVRNHQSARRRAWARLWQSLELPGLAEAVVEQEDVAARFLGDVTALDRLGALVGRLETIDQPPAHIPLVLAQIASMEHRFADALSHLSMAKAAGARRDAIGRLELAIDQACGRNLDMVLEARRREVDGSDKLGDLVPLGSLLADLGETEAAEQVYHRAIERYDDVSPFAPAWVCFQLGLLWGEIAADPDEDRAARWYGQALSYLPAYAKARVHLSEILTSEGRLAEAEALLVGILVTGDPEVHWRLSEVYTATGDRLEAERHLEKADAIYRGLLEKYPLAYADHGAEFYLVGGNDPARAFELARANLENRPTLRAFVLAFEAAEAAGENAAASEIRKASGKRWNATKAFRCSSLFDGSKGSARRHDDTA